MSILETDYRQYKEIAFPDFSTEAVVLCTSPDGHKNEGMRHRLLNSVYALLTTKTYEPTKIPEDLYNEIDRRPDLIAGAKVAQVGANFHSNVSEIFKDSQISFRSDVLLIANDIILDIACGEGDNWKTYNKPKKNSSPAEIKTQLIEMLCGECNKNSNTIKARFRCGAAAYSPRKERGILGEIEVFFEFTPFTEDEVNVYLEDIGHQKALETNGSCHWSDHDIFTTHIDSIGGIKVGDEYYEDESRYFQDFVSGSLPGIADLITEANTFINSNSAGENTGYMNKLGREIPKLNMSPNAEWGTWRKEQIFDINYQ
jgi:hypothetical protein